MKRILVAGLTSNPGGMESVVMNYFRNIDHNELVFDFLYVTESIAYADEIKSYGGRLFRVTSKKKNWIKYKRQLKEFFDKFSKDYIAIWYNTCSMANIDYLIQAKKHNIEKRIIHCHNSNNGEGVIKGVFHKINQYRIKNYVNEFWTCSYNSCNWFFGNKVDKNNVKLINNAIDTIKYTTDLELRKKAKMVFGENNKIILGNIGRLMPQKNQIFLFEVMEKLEERYPNRYCLILIGDGEKRDEYNRIVNEKKLDKCIRFLGVQTDINFYLQLIDVFVFPSLFEGLSVSLLEAQASGVPCIVSDRIDPISLLNENIVKIGINSYNVTEWCDAIVETDLSRKVCLNEFYKRGLDIKKEAVSFQQYFTGVVK